MAQIRIDRLRKEFGSFTAVQGSTFTIEDGEFFMLLGPSGCGKTTTLRMMAGLELPTSGEVYIDGEEVAQKRASQRDIAFVFQMFALYPHMTVAGNIGYPLRSEGVGRAETRARVLEVARLLGIEPILHRPVGRLSGGDRQRVALGRAIVRRPKAFFMDEPLGALDAEFREHMAEELRALHDRIGATTVYVTHDQLEAMQMGDKIVVMNHGVVEQFGVPQDIYDWPATLFVADFIGSPPMNFLPFDGVGPARRRPRPPRRRRGRRPGPARRRLGRARPRRPPRARPPRRRRPLPRRGRRHRISRHHPDRDAPHRPRRHQGPPRRRPGRCAPARPPASPSTPAPSPSSRRRRAARLRSAGQREGARMAEVTLQGITKSFGPVTALDDVTMTIPDGSFVVLLGPTGAGKTTTLRLISGLDRPDRGEVLIGRPPGDGPDPGAAQRRDGLPAIFALPAPDGAREPRLPAELADPAHPARRDRAQGRAPSPRCCRSPTSSTTRRPPSPAARCSASRSAGRWCATPRST